MEAFGIFGFMIGLVSMMSASSANSHVAMLRAEVAQLRAELQRGRA